MGLKNKNYTINGYEYPEVYAVFNGEIKKYGDEYEAGFNIHATRELALNNKPLEVKKIRVQDWDRKSDIVVAAYAAAKGFYIYEEPDYENGGMKEIKIPNALNGWEDDIAE